MLVQIYAAHLRHGDLFPVWSSSDAYGMGTPVLLYYQRAFFTVGGIVFILLGGHLKATLVATIGVFLVIGAYGMRKALAVVTDNRLLSSAAAVAFLFANWTFSEWLVRADLAEFAAMMIVPWLLFWCLQLIKTRRCTVSIVPTMVALVWAHNTIALASLFLLVATGVAFVVAHGVTGVRAIARRAVLFAGLTVLLLAPGLVAELRMGASYDPSTTIIYDNAFIHSFQFPRSAAFLYEPFTWLARVNPSGVFGVNNQIDFGISALLILGIVALAVRATRGLGQTDTAPADRPSIDKRVLLVLASSFAFYLFMQFRVSLPIWHAFWQLEVLGYPFRMMALLTPVAFTLAVLIADWFVRSLQRRQTKLATVLPRFLLVPWLASFVFLSPLTAHEPPRIPGPEPYAPFVPIADITAASHSTFATSTAAPLFPEYLPKVTGPSGRTARSAAAIYEALHARHVEAQSLSSTHCSISQISGTEFESLEISYRVSCEGPTRVALPISFNTFTSVVEDVSPSARRPVPVLHVARDPRIVIAVVSAGSHVFVAHLPTIVGILF